MKNKLFISLLVFVAIVNYSYSQQNTRWKAHRSELVGGIGATGFLGELGGKQTGVGTNDFKDLEMSLTRPLLSVGYRYKFLEKLSGKIAFSWGWLKGDDALTKEPSRMNRNLSFHSPIMELAGQLEYWILKDNVQNSYYTMASKLKVNRFGIYIFGGVAGFYFEPKDKFNGTKLRPLKTEGVAYSPLQISIPLGLGFKYNLNRKWSIGLEGGPRITFTDYIDDVSDKYWYYSADTGGALDPATSKSAYYSYGKYKTNNTDGVQAIYTGQDGTKYSEVRGDKKNNDMYIFTTITVGYRLTKEYKDKSKF